LRFRRPRIATNAAIAAAATPTPISTHAQAGRPLLGCVVAFFPAAAPAAAAAAMPPWCEVVVVDVCVWTTVLVGAELVTVCV
jgi:hypothetical protein